MKMTEKMRSLIRLGLMGVILVSCSFPTTTQPTQNSFAIIQPTAALSQIVTLQLTVQADTSAPISAEGQVVKINYAIKNTGTTSISGNIVVTGITAVCPAINTVGNLDNALDVNETLVCTSDYTVTKADLDNGSFKINAAANINGINSNQVSATVPTKVLTLTKTVDPATYDHVGQQITYTYVIKNSGALVIGPAQFTVNDPGLGTPFNCGDANTRLDPNATVTCKATYTITQSDMNAATVTTGATASTNGVVPSPAASATITRSGVVANPGNFVRGSTIQHRVVKGEWLWQIARCYGADPQEVVQANPQLPYPAQISPDTTVNVPNIGSNGTIYGPPCVELYTVKSGDTWTSIAQQFNADPVVLKMVNKNGLSGQVVVPRNSAGGTQAPASDLIRINFAAGATSVTQTGVARAGNRTIHYVLKAIQGQVMTVKLTAPANSVSLTIYAPNGSTLKSTDLNLTWNGTLPSDGDYRLDVNNAQGLGAANVSFTLEVSVTGNCVDFARNLKSIGNTHFSLCGQTDSAGKTRISLIRVYQRPEEVGQGGLSQDINMPVDTSTPLNDQNSLIIGDMNYDGFDDFRILQSVPAGPNVPYVYFIFDPTPRKFIYSEAYGKITSPEFPGNSQIVSKWRESAAKWGIDTYKVATNVPALTQRETWEAINSTQALHRIITYEANGVGKVTTEETIPLPTQP
jgi:LysM repeat protein